MIERADGTLAVLGTRVRARRGGSINACLQLAQELLGDARLRSGRQLAALAGALPGMRVTVAPDDATDLLLVARGGGYTARRILYRGRDGRAYLLNARLDAKPSGHGLGTVSQIIQAAAAMRLGVRRLEAIASSLDGDVGWLVFPRWGFDAELEEHFRQALPAAWASITTLTGVLRQPGGWQWWRRHGAILDVEFDLRPGSHALQRLRTYAEARLASGRPLPPSLPGEFPWRSLGNTRDT